MSKKNYYAVRKGRKIGIFSNWSDCLAAVKGFSGAIYKGFETEEDAQTWLNNCEGGDTCENQKLAENNLIQSDKIDYEVYTDGSYINGKYSFGYAFIKDGQIVFEESGVGEDSEAAKMRNVAGEIEAVKNAVEKAISLNVRIRIYHDYSGISLWVTGEWQAKNKFTQAYVKFMSTHRDIFEFKKVIGHSGDRYNDYVDQLAKKALGI
jgi:ribonuclease HI